ncbi:hypothetical protein MKK69_09370 [Methylobacterium sp. J-026]|uniref:hypothetical protein n=1 Tax=Methylobacterium sp. J-026 TaxID=2836624 RepID=UPI001FB8A4C3|nr:hypothetical protein [Methylobacterium sp. J-026]MCJ2134262.1 hypothetical protein [Methylobacterium sp. J-026]
MLEDVIEEQARLGIGVIFRGLIGFDEAFDQMLRGTGIAVAGHHLFRGKQRLLARTPDEVARGFERAARLCGRGAQRACDFEAPICVKAVCHGRSNFRCAPAR